jgi:quercetin dioxygenase-like cupin family protein
VARPHIEFVQTQTLPWKTLGEGASRPGADAKALSYDPDTQACTAILRYPPGWRMNRPHFLECDDEFLVLEGELSVGAVTYGPGDYAYLPAGMPRPDMASADGATVLTFYEGPHRSLFAPAPDGLYDPARLIARIATREMPWGAPSDPVVAATANACGRKLLREDPATGERTWMLKMGPDDPSRMTTGRTETHPVVEETFLLDGEISMPWGVLKRGAYFWRPPGIEHGPVGTRTGFVGIFRCKGGPLSTVWSDRQLPIDWQAPYAPVLPPQVQALAFQSYDSALPY